MSSMKKPGRSGVPSLHGTLGPLRGHKMSQNSEKKVNIAHKGLSLQAPTHIGGAQGSQKAPTE